MRTTFLAVTIIALTACSDAPAVDDDQPQVQDTIAAAEAAYDEAVFDTIQWASDSAAVERGAQVWQVACQECHGPEGRGGTNYVNERGDTLHPPAFTAPDWQLANNPTAIHRKVYVGNTLGMPHWGLRRMTPRDIDAVTRYALRLHERAQTNR